MKSSPRIFNNKVVIITGAAQGIGRTLALSFAQAGAQVVVVDIQRKKSQEVVRMIHDGGGRGDFLYLDLRRKNAGKRMINEVIKRHGKIDILINNARSRIRTDIGTETEDSWDEAMAVNLRATFFSAKEALRHMNQQGSGIIINIGSVAGRLVCHESPAYHASKAALEHITRYLSVQITSSAVRVVGIVPGFIVKDEHLDRYLAEDNNSFRHIAEFVHPVGRTGRAQDVAAAAFFLASTQASFVNGSTITVDGGLTVHEPSNLVFDFSSRS